MLPPKTSILLRRHPEGDHRPWIIECSCPHLDSAVVRRVETLVGLGFADDRIWVEPLLSHLAADRAGVGAGLQRRDADVAIELRTPWLLIRSDQKPQAAAGELYLAAERSRLLQCER